MYKTTYKTSKSTYKLSFVSLFPCFAAKTIIIFHIFAPNYYKLNQHNNENKTYHRIGSGSHDLYRM